MMDPVKEKGYVGRLAQLVERTLCTRSSREACVRSGFRASYRPSIFFYLRTSRHRAECIPSFLELHHGQTV